MKSCSSSFTCWVGFVVVVILMALAIQGFTILIGAAVAAAIGHSILIVASYLLCWPIFFLSLFVSLAVGLAKYLCACANQSHSNKKEYCSEKRND